MSTTTPTVLTDLNVRILQEGYGAEAWHGPEMKTALAEVSSALAFWRPGEDRHNIAEIAMHHAFYVHSVRSRLSEQAPEAFALNGEDWFPLASARALSWSDITSVVDTEQSRLAKLVADMQTQLEATLGVQEVHLEALSFSAEPKGIAASMLDPGQTSILRELIDCYLARLPDELADQQARLVEREFDRLGFLWAGGAERGQPHYYRIQGERMFIEYDNSQRGANHIHAVWRDLANDFGGDVLARHYAQSRH